MLTKEQKRVYRSDLFRHLDGLATAPVAYAFHKQGVLSYLLEKESVTLSKICADFDANEGYLNVGLRILASQGWLAHEVDNAKDEVHIKLNEKSKIAFSYCDLYKDVIELLQLSGKYHRRKFNVEPFKKMAAILPRFKAGYGIEVAADETLDKQPILDQVLKHIEGVLVAPSVVALGMSGMFHKYFMEASFKAEEFHKDAESFTALLDFFSYLGWFEKKRETYRFTDKGLFYARRASAYGVTVSYSPTFRKVDELMFGDPTVLRQVGPDEPEAHVDREMNVWGSGGAHGAYFKKVDEIIMALFNQPIEQQPKGIVDMGCGNGAYLQHLYEVIEQRTLRGTMLEEHPLFLVGADYNQAALKVSRANLISADIWAKLIWGDIGRPDLLAAHLQEDYGIALGDLLNVRTFLDHNRIWEDPQQLTPNRVSTSSGAFAHRGVKISNNAVEDNLREHLQKWSPYLQRFGLLVIELHTISPSLAAQHIGRTAATAYDATHGFSDQYIVEIEVFHKMAEEAGLFVDQKYFGKFPNSDLATVSINLLRGK